MASQHNRKSTSRKRRRRPSKLAAFARLFLTACGILVTIYFLISLFFSQQGETPSNSANNPAQSTASSQSVAKPSATATPTPTETPAPTPDPAVEQAKAMLADPLMILVSAAHPMPEDHVVNTKVADTLYTGKELMTEAADAFIAMQSAASKDGHVLRLQSGYRSVSYQAGLYDAETNKWKNTGMSEEDARAKAATIVLPPGYSEHACGLAADINCPEFLSLDEGFEHTAAFTWLTQNAADYGFILRYTRECEAITAVIYEPWHWRYVGVENAKIINESGLCLEEFLTQLSATVENG